MANVRFAIVRNGPLTAFAPMFSRKVLSSVGQVVSSYEKRCDEEMAAAESASSLEARLAHLELALRFALLASRARQKCEIVGMKSWSVGEDPQD